MEINKEIEHHTQQRYLITYASKGKEKLQTPAQLLQLPPQQLMQQQLLQQPSQQSNLDPMAYAPIAKLDNFTSKENDTQVWLNDMEKAIAANRWNDVRAMQAISYFLKDTTDLCLLVIPEDAQPNHPENNQQLPLTSNILSATVTKNETLATIFPFELEETVNLLLFSRAALEEKLITAMYTNAKVDGHPIKLILNSGSAGSIITRQLMDQLSHQVDHTASARIITADGATKISIGEIDDFPIKVNGITIPIKVLMMEAT
ncbi:hypothetical protein G9A89_018715 [Geosiphon pyriformis]|nr:hypothetical protein G9A89_018715 [Geosiphon pyriformis]